MKEKKKPTFKDFIQRKSNVIKNPEVFQLKYTPKDILKRPETYLLFREVADIIKYNKPNHIYLRGLSGTGKTVTIKNIQQSIDELEREKFFTVYENCRDKTAIEVLNSIMGSDLRGYSENKLIQVLLNDIKEQKNLKKNIIIILDEVDRSRTVLNNLIYKLTRPEEVIKNFSCTISLILISNNLDWIETLDTAVRSSLQVKTINFKIYAQSQLKEILKDRIKLGFYSERAITNQLLDLIVKKTCDKRSGDSRTAIETLFYAAKKAEEGSRHNISEKDIEHSFPIVLKNIERERVMRLDDHKFMILYACYNSQTKKLKEIYKLYSACIARTPIRKLGYTMFFNNIKYLDNQELIEKEGDNGYDKRGKELTIRVKIPFEPVLEEFKTRIVRQPKQEGLHIIE